MRAHLPVLPVCSWLAMLCSMPRCFSVLMLFLGIVSLHACDHCLLLLLTSQLSDLCAQQLQHLLYGARLGAHRVVAHLVGYDKAEAAADFAVQRVPVVHLLRVAVRCAVVVQVDISGKVVEQDLQTMEQRLRQQVWRRGAGCDRQHLYHRRQQCNACNMCSQLVTMKPVLQVPWAGNVGAHRDESVTGWRKVTKEAV